MLIFGYGGGFPNDNCSSSLEKAQKYGLDGVMLQVYKTKDDQLIIFKEKLDDMGPELDSFNLTLNEVENFLNKEFCLLQEVLTMYKQNSEAINLSNLTSMNRED